MIYDSLDILPIKTFYKIQETGNIDLLNPSNDPRDIDFNELFDRLSDQFNMLDKGDDFDRELVLEKEIAHLESKVKFLTLGVDILRFAYNDEIKLIIEKEIHHKIRTNRTEYYYKDLERIDKKILIINSTIQRLLDQRKSNNGNASSNSTIDDMLASICSILSVSFDFNTIPCTTYLAYKKQTNSKIKAQEEQLQKLNIK